MLYNTLNLSHNAPTFDNTVSASYKGKMLSDFPTLVSEWFYFRNGDLKPENIPAGSNKKYWWICSECDNEWEAIANNRTKGRGCPACSNKALHIDGRNSISSTHPQLAAEFHPTRNGNLSPDFLVAGTNKDIWWICSECDNEWVAKGSHRKRGRGCGVCSKGRKFVHTDGRNSLETLHPTLAKEWHPTKNGKLGPENFTAVSGKIKWWLCLECSNEWEASISNRVRGNTGCNACSNKRVHTDGRNSLQSMYPKIAEEWHPTKNGNLRPEEVLAGMQAKAWWLCSLCQNVWDTRPYLRTKMDYGCPACTNKRLHIDGRNSLATTNPKLAAEWHPTKNGNLRPEDIINGARRVCWWLCPECTKDWPTRVDHRIRGSICPDCAKSGFSPNKPAYYYVNEIFNPETNQRLYYKGGISLDWRVRLNQLKRNLPEEYRIINLEQIYFNLGIKAQKLEKKLLAIEQIRAEKQDFGGGTELFVCNPLDYARVNGFLDD